MAVPTATSVHHPLLPKQPYRLCARNSKRTLESTLDRGLLTPRRVGLTYFLPTVELVSQPDLETFANSDLLALFCLHVPVAALSKSGLCAGTKCGARNAMPSHGG